MARNQLRIIGGEHRGRKLHFPDVKGLRPTADRVRETLFNWLQGELYAARVLDLFAGSGALGFEALSRGAAHVQLVERSREAAEQLRQNIELLRAEQVALVAQMDALRWLDGSLEGAFDLVLLDPPFADKLLGRAAAGLEAKGCLSKQAWVYLEQDVSHAWPDLPASWHLHREGAVGQAAFRLMQRNG